MNNQEQITAIKNDGEALNQAIEKLKTKYSYEGSILRLKANLEYIVNKFGGVDNVKGKRVLDLGCGHTLDKESQDILKETKRNPYRSKLLKERGSYDTLIEGIPRMYEPWLCRALLELGAHPVGIDIGDLGSEEFEHYQLDLSKEGALDFLPDKSFDFIVSEVFGSSPQLEMMTTTQDRVSLGDKLKEQVKRLLKDGGQTSFQDFFGENS